MIVHVLRSATSSSFYRLRKSCSCRVLIIGIRGGARKLYAGSSSSSYTLAGSVLSCFRSGYFFNGRLAFVLNIEGLHLAPTFSVINHRSATSSASRALWLFRGCSRLAIKVPCSRSTPGC